jgi:hypothetical protein
MLSLLVVLAAVVCNNAQTVEEFHAHGPTEFHDLALNKFLAMRKANPDLKLDHDSPFLKSATEHAVRRGMRKPDHEFELRVSCWFVVDFFFLML